MSTEAEGVDAHYAYFRSIYGQLSESPVGLRLRNLYDYTKNSNSMVQKSLDGVEVRLYDVNDSVIAPLYERYCYPATERLAKASQSSYDQGTNIYHSVKDLAQAGTTLGLGVAVVGAQIGLIVSASMTNLLLDGIILSKDVGSGVVNRTKNVEKQVEAKIFATLENCKNIAGVPVNKASEYTNSLLDVMNAFLDNFLHLPVNENENPESSIPQRIRHLTSRVSQAIVSKTVQPCQQQIAALLENLRARLTLVENLKKQRDNVRTHLMSTSLSDLYARVEKEAAEIKAQPSEVLLRSIQGCAKRLNASLSAISQKSSQTLPSSASERLHSAINYIENLDKTFEGADSIHAIRDEVIEEARQKLSELLQVAKFAPKFPKEKSVLNEDI
ncbi:unnamed protein product [Bursaphelenchus okinawaensis]|uniref:Uncharacterized protein n=1 Tax=Bursaphelenchus okinawaensis TaxID=465554 RepID=A0A811JSW3_9BILA|nr:unnamed protein product [Bursaphelenchus okinawaensis]CAG9081730.1 unnamed protein product [Bursaphelenchus okinawaensis]